MLRSIGRIVWVATAFVLAVLAGIAVLGLVGLERATAVMQGRPGTGDLGSWLELAGWAFGLTEWAAALSVVPALLAVLIGEIGHIRSLVYWVVAGGLAAVAVPILNGMALSASSDFALPANSLMQILATAGFAAGVVYWALAGRRS